MSNIHLRSTMVKFKNYDGFRAVIPDSSEPEFNTDAHSYSQNGVMYNPGSVSFPSNVISATVALQSFNMGYHIITTHDYRNNVKSLRVRLVDVNWEGPVVNFKALLGLTAAYSAQSIKTNICHIRALITAECE